MCKRWGILSNEMHDCTFLWSLGRALGASTALVAFNEDQHLNLLNAYIYTFVWATTIRIFHFAQKNVYLHLIPFAPALLAVIGAHIN
jgi:hypothetical protein